MKYTLEFRIRPDYLLAYLRVDKPIPEISFAYRRDLRSKCIETGSTKLLVVRDIPQVLSTMDFFHVSEDSVALLRGIKTAWVNPYPSLRSALEFSITVANNRGAIYGLFSDGESAAAWLAGQPPRMSDRIQMPAQNTRARSEIYPDRPWLRSSLPLIKPFDPQA